MSAISSTSDALDLWSNPKRQNRAMEAQHDSVARVLGNATTLGMILGYLECDRPLTDFEQNMVYKLGWCDGRYNPTEVCWNWYANWFPNGLSQWPLSLSHTSEDDVRTTACTKNLWHRLHALCRSLSLSPLEVAHLPHGGMGEAVTAIEGVQMGLFAKLHTIYVDGWQRYAFQHQPWLERPVARTQLTTQLLTHLQHFPNVRNLKIFVHTNQQVELLSHMTQLEVLDLEVDDDIHRDDEVVYLSPLCTLTRLRCLFLNNDASGDDFASFVSSLHNLEVLELQDIQVYKDNTVWVSMRGLAALRRFSLPYGSTNINILKSLLTLPHSDVDIHLPIESIAELKTTQTPKQRQAYCEALRKLMRRFGLGFSTSFTTFASRRWPARRGDVTDPHVVDQYVLRLCGYGVTCSRCREQGWHKDCKNCLSCAPLYLGDYLTKWESRKRCRLDRGPPKGIRSAYMLWCEDNRAAVEKDHRLAVRVAAALPVDLMAVAGIQMTVGVRFDRRIERIGFRHG